MIAYKKIIFSLVFIFGVAPAFAQDISDDVEFFLPIRFSFEHARDRDLRVNSFGIHPEFFLEDDLSVGYTLRFGTAYLEDSAKLYVQYPLGALLMEEVARSFKKYDYAIVFYPFALISLVIPQRISYHIKHAEYFRTELFTEPFSSVYMRDFHKRPKVTFTLGARLNYMWGGFAISPYGSIRMAYDGSFLFTNFGVMLSASFN